MALPNYPRQKVVNIQKTLDDAVNAIRADRNLSEAGRRTQIAKVTLAARKQAEALKAETRAARETRRAELERRVFGIAGTPNPTELMVMRDSRDRAANLESADDGLLKMRLAAQAGDTFMARAIAQVAAAKGWRDVLETFTNTAAFDTRAALEELADLPSGRGTNIADTAAFKIRDPREFLGTRDEVVEAFARGDQSMANHLENRGAPTLAPGPGVVFGN
jgi:hypothetical protein